MGRRGLVAVKLIEGAFQDSGVWQSARYAEKAGRGPFASLLHLVRLGKLDAESARKVVKEPNAAKKLLGKDLTETQATARLARPNANQDD
jgi:hypothetical protein